MDITVNEKQIAKYAKALSHPVRVHVLKSLLSKRTCYSGDLSDELHIAKSTLSQHLKELKNAGLIQGKVEYPKIRYCVNMENWKIAREVCKGLFEF